MSVRRVSGGGVEPRRMGMVCREIGGGGLRDKRKEAVGALDR